MKVFNKPFLRALFYSVLLGFFSVQRVFAADPEDELEGYIGDIQKVIVGIGVFAAFFLIPYAAVLMASGNPDQIKKGRDWLTSIVSGLVLLILSGLIIRVIGTDLLRL